MYDAVYINGTKVPVNLQRNLELLNHGDLVVVIYQNGNQEITNVIRSNDGTWWFLGTQHIMTVQYQPFKVLFHDENILAIVNVTQLSSTFCRV